MASFRELIVKVTAESSEFTRGLAAAQRQALNLSEKFGAIGETLTRSVTLPLGALGGFALRSAAQFDSLTRGLTAVAGSSTEAAKQMERLKKVAELPGLGFREAVQGSINLQAAGFSAQTAERALKAFGNALATVGKGRAELDGVITALSQIQSKGKVSAEEINQLAERLPQIRGVLKEAFGTADTEVIQKLGISVDEFIQRTISGFEKLPKATGGLANSFENLRDRAEQALGQIGNALAPAAESGVRILERLATTAEQAAKAFITLPEPIKDVAIAIAGLAFAAAPVSKLFSQFEKLKAAAIKLVEVLGRLPKGLIPSVSIGAIAGTAVFAALDKLNDFGNKADTSSAGVKRLAERYKELGAAVGGNASTAIDKLRESVFSVAGAARSSADSLDRAFAELGIKSTVKLREELAGAQKNLETIRAAVARGAASQQDLANATAKVQAAQDALNGSVEKTATKFASVDFAQTSLGARLLAAEYGTLIRKQNDLFDSIVKLRALGSIEFGSATFDAPAIERVSDVQKELLDNAKKFAEQQAKITQEYLRQAGLAEIAAAAERVRAADTLERIQNEQRGQKGVDFGQLQFPDLRNARKEMDAFARQVSTVVTDLSRGIADAIIKGESLGQTFRRIGQDVASAIIRFAIERGIKLLIQSLDDVIGKLGSVGKALANVFGGASSAASSAAGIAGSAASTAGQVASSALSATSVIGAIGSITQSIFAALQFTQLRRIEQDVGRIEVSARGSLSQSISIQNTLNQWLPYLENLIKLNDSIVKLYEGLSAIDFGGMRPAMAGGISVGQITVTGSGNPRETAQSISRELRKLSASF